MIQLALTLWVSLASVAQTIQSDCAAAEIKALQSQDIINQFVLKGNVHLQDCAPVKGPGEKELLLMAIVVNARGGYESYLSLFERKGFNEKSLALFKSFMVAFDLFPILFKKTHRLMFVHPSSDPTRLAIFLNAQTAPDATRLGRWDYSFDKKELVEIKTKYWILEAGVLPKIYDDRGVFRALIDSRSVEL